MKEIVMFRVLAMLLSFTPSLSMAGSGAHGGGSSSAAQRYFGIKLPKNSTVTFDTAKARQLFYLNGLSGLEKLQTVVESGQASGFTKEQIAAARDLLRDVYFDTNNKSFVIDPKLQDENKNPLAATNSSDGVITLNPQEYFTSLSMEYAPAVADQIREIISVHEILSQPEIALEKTNVYVASSQLFKNDSKQIFWDPVLASDKRASWGGWRLEKIGAMICAASYGDSSFQFSLAKIYCSKDDGISWDESLSKEQWERAIAAKTSPNDSTMFHYGFKSIISNQNNMWRLDAPINSNGITGVLSRDDQILKRFRREKNGLCHVVLHGDNLIIASEGEGRGDIILSKDLGASWQELRTHPSFEKKSSGYHINGCSDVEGPALTVSPGGHLILGVTERGVFRSRYAYDQMFRD